MATAQDPSSRPAGHALVVAQSDLRPGVARVLQRQGMVVGYADDPYAAISELCRRPLVYRAVVLSLQGVYQEELKVIPTIKRRLPHIDVYLSHTDGRQGAMAEGVRLGADGLLSEDGIHHIAKSVPTPLPAATPPAAVAPPVPPTAPVAVQRHAPVTSPVDRMDFSASDPLLSAEELRALLEDEPAIGGQA